MGPFSLAKNIGGMCTVYSYVKWLCQEIKQIYPKVPIVVGGSVSSPMPEFLLSHTEADIAVIGEGEHTMQELLTCFETDEDIGSVPGICYKKGKEILRAGNRQRISDLDNLPFPAWDLVPMDIYIANATLTSLESRWIPQDVQSNLSPLRAVTIISTRGCPERCTFCYRSMGHGIRLRSITNVINEIKTLMDNYGANIFDFLDENFTVSRSRALEFCDYMEAEKLSIAYRITGSRVDGVDEELLLRLKETGCYGIMYGIESGSQKMLDVMKKRTTVADNKRAIEIARKVGLRCNAPWIIGMPGETPETVEESRRFYKEVWHAHLGVYYATPYPGTEIWETAKQMGRIGDEEQFIISLGDITEYTVNLTDAFTDKELRAAARRVVKDVNRAAAGGWLQVLVKDMLSRIRGVFHYYRIYGLQKTVRRILQEVNRS